MNPQTNVYNWAESVGLNVSRLPLNDWIGRQSSPTGDIYNIDTPLSSISLETNYAASRVMPSVETPNQLANNTADALDSLNQASGRTAYNTAASTGAIDNLIGAYQSNLSELNRRAGYQMATGAFLKTAASAVGVFDQLLTWGMRRDNINLQKRNAKQAADNQMMAIDNQVMYIKNQLMDKFNSLVANNTVMMAAKNLRVTAANILEASKETAHDLDMDFRTAESNAELEKINLRNAKKQADISAKVQKTKQMTDFIGSAANLGLNLATGGGTGMSWGNLYNNFMQY